MIFKNIKKYWPAVIATIVIIFAAALIIARCQDQRAAMILFRSDSCPHCVELEEYIVANNIKEKFDFQDLEISQNRDNAALLVKKAARCGLDTSQGLNIPFFFDGKNCLVGSDEIINFFQSK